MSQEDTTATTTRTTTKYSNNHYQYHNYNNAREGNNNNHNTMKYENKRSPTTTTTTMATGVALYENFIPLSNNNSNNNNTTTMSPTNFTLDSETMKSAPFIDVQRFVHQTTNALNGRDTISSHTLRDDIQRDYDKQQQHIPDYENYGFKRNLDKKVLLQKYFRTALVGPRDNIYENLCRGCNYGVFTARGPLCSFCECIVNGVHSINASPAESSNNIYENICELCSQFYSGNEEDCQCRKNKEIESSFEEIQIELTEKQGNLKSVLKNGSGSEDCLINEKKKKVKISKSLSFSKSGKPKKLASFWETLRKPKTANPTTRKPLEIVHNVDGYDQVFHTKESFDLQRICELKRSATSCSDQHIYGRLKPRDLDLVKSQEDFLSTQSLTQNDQGVGKKRRISKARFLRSNSGITPSKNLAESTCSSLTVTTSASSTDILQSVYLNNSVCQWMSALRHEFNVNISLSHCVNTCILNANDEECDCLCYPKSIPAKKLLPINPNPCKNKVAPNERVTNKENILSNSIKQTNLVKTHNATTVFHLDNTTDAQLIREKCKQEEDFTIDPDSTEIVTLRRHTVIRRDSLGDSREGEQQFCPPTLLAYEDPYQQMVEEFKIHLVNKQVKQQQSQRLANNENMANNNNNIMAASAGVNGNSQNNNTPASLSQTTVVDIPLRQAISNHNKVKRQGMYLRLNEHDNLPNDQSNNSLMVLSEEKCMENKQNGSNSSSRESIDESILKPSSKQNKRELNTVKDYFSTKTEKESENTEPKTETETATTIKRSGIHEGNILRAFEALLRQEREQQLKTDNNKETETIEESQTLDINNIIYTHEQLDNGKQFTDGEKGVLQPFVLPSKNEDETILTQYCFRATIPTVDFLHLINDLQLSSSLNTAVIYYTPKEKILFVFLLWYISRNGEKYKHTTHGQLMRKYQRFLAYIQSKNNEIKPTIRSLPESSQNQITNEEAMTTTSTAALTVTTTSATLLPPLNHSPSTNEANSVDLKLDLMKTNGNIYGRIKIKAASGSGELTNSNNNNDVDNGKINTNNSSDSCDCQIGGNEVKTINTKLSETNAVRKNISEFNNNNNNKKMKKPPEVPKRNPNTKLSPSTEQLPPLPLQRNKLSPPSIPKTLKEENPDYLESQNPKVIQDTKICAKPCNNIEDTESIYQPIWKFKTVGEAQERFKTDEDYYTLKELQAEQNSKDTMTSTIPAPEIFIQDEEEDHSEWEPDEEFVFTTKLGPSTPASVRRTESIGGSLHNDPNGTIRSNSSKNSSLGSSSLSGSTITDFASSTVTLASTASSSLMHHLFRNVGIFYSLTDANLCAIIYDYDRIHSSKYFAKKPLIHNDMTTSIFGNNQHHHHDNINDSGLGKSPTPSLISYPKQSPVPVQRNLVHGPNNNSPKQCNSESDIIPEPAKVLQNANSCDPAVVVVADPASLPTSNDLSVLAWKQLLLNVNYMEDEEDMIVSEAEILRAKEIKEDAEPQKFMKKIYKSHSTDNILDLPLDDKKTITERVRSKLQRGILNLNTKSSPKSEKKAFRKSQTTSLYLEDGLKPKNPIFGAPLDQLELNRTTCPNVPRFVADSIEYIERKDRIVQDGLYRACGNKFTIDELKQKLTKSYIYDPKLIAADDIHTITSLLKQFFRDLPQPLIPQETYNRLARDLLKNQEGIDTFRIAINDMPEPNRSTLAFLVKHLTNVAACSASNRMNASNLAIVWGPSLFALNEDKTYDIGRMNSLAKALIENYDRIFHTNERLL
ncbi:rho GTPase activating protein at 18B [Haematobia irritans]|uniref:rho GTPase activating protein at 18B n=1 Tax=Haematobia irritans TaxID=7368 RepID=UPI003F50C7FF